MKHFLLLNKKTDIRQIVVNHRQINRNYIKVLCDQSTTVLNLGYFYSNIIQQQIWLLYGSQGANHSFPKLSFE